MIERDEKKKKKKRVAYVWADESKDRNEGGEPRSVTKRKLCHEVSSVRVSETGKIECCTFPVDFKEADRGFIGKCQFIVLSETEGGFGDRSLVAAGKDGWFRRKGDKNSKTEREKKNNANVVFRMPKKFDTDEER